MAVIDPRIFPLRHGARCTVRCASAEDAGALVEHQAHMMQTDPHSVSEPEDKRRTLEEWTEILAEGAADPWRLMLIATDPANPPPRGPLLGGLSYTGNDRKKVRHHGYFGLSVHADWRGRGVGSAMMTMMLDWAAAHPDIEKVCLGVFAINQGAQRLYARMGFRQEHVSPMYFKLGPGQYVDDVWMAIYVKPGVAPAGFHTWGGR